MIDFDALAVGGALVVFATATATRSGGRERLFVAATAAGAAVAMASTNAVLTGVAVLVAALAARRAWPAGAGAGAWAFLGDALVAGGLGAAALDARTVDLAWSGPAGVPGWAVTVVAVGAVMRLVVVGPANVAMTLVGVVVGVRLAGVPVTATEPTWLVAGAVVAIVLAWAARPVTATLIVAWAGFGVGGGADAAPAALLLAGGGLAAAAASFEITTRRPLDWAEIGSSARAWEAPRVPEGWSGLLAVAAAVPAGVGLVRVTADGAHPAGPVLAALLVVVVLAARPPGAVVSAAAALPVRIGAVGLGAAALLVPLLAPGWWMDRLHLSDPARALSDALTAARAGSVVAIAVGLGAAALTVAAVRVGKKQPTAAS